MGLRNRNTPTGVGKTYTKVPGGSAFAEHPHGRGEDADAVNYGSDVAGTPPRAWGRLRPAVSRLTDVGNTPTGVGKTLPEQGLHVVY